MRYHHQKGSQLVEFALVLPLLILTIFAILDLGFITYDKAIMTNASREAARQAIVLSASTWSTSSVAQVACNYSAGLITVSSGTHNASCTGTADPVITVTPSTAPAFNTPVTVSMRYVVNGFSMGSFWNLGTAAGSIGSAFTVTASTQMIHE